MASADERTWRSRTLRAPTFAFAEAEGRKLRAQGKSLAEKVKEALLDPTNHQGITDARRAYGAFEEGQAWAGGTVFDDPRFRRQGEPAEPGPGRRLPMLMPPNQTPGGYRGPDSHHAHPNSKSPGLRCGSKGKGKGKPSPASALRDRNSKTPAGGRSGHGAGSGGVTTERKLDSYFSAQSSGARPPASAQAPARPVASRFAGARGGTQQK